MLLKQCDMEVNKSSYKAANVSDKRGHLLPLSIASMHEHEQTFH